MTEKKLMAAVTALCIIFSICGTSGVCTYMIYGKEAPTGNDLVSEESMDDLDSSFDFSNKGALGNEIIIQLPTEYAEEDIEITDNTIDRCSDIYIKNIEENYLVDNPITGVGNNIKKLLYGYDHDTARLRVCMDKCCVSSYYMDEDSNAHITFEDIKDVYKHVIVLDPSYGGDERGTVSYGISEADVVLGLAQAVRDNLDPNDVYVVMTREDAQHSLSETEKINLCESIEADLRVRFNCNANRHSRTKSGMIVEYNNYPGRVLCEAIDRNTTDEIQVIYSDDSSGNVKETTAIQIKAGYLTNKSDVKKLTNDEWINQTATAIAEALSL